MPLFEFLCRDCEKPFQQLVHSYRNIGDVACPQCGGTGETIEKVVSVGSFVVKGYNAKTGYSRKG